ncbi:hypothetical protein [Flavobacterium aciduliphilum]|uniref:Uncharacterized protein n=1 Tax=Flavobacterium aciduliphilum TaxID=1101402 RepID=A0A328YI58_9FLAO|nr:hypothetical protein [Flavobacterium aciduliphilum]RAR73788.1 hypothetical protein CLV55_103107 [Flavobacterium aciduliphilum]
MLNIQSTTLPFNQSKLKIETKVLNYYNYEYFGSAFLTDDDSSEDEFDGTPSVLTDIINDMSLDYFNLAVIHEESKLISLVFEDEKSVYRVCFPSGYPNLPPLIFASNDVGVCCPVEAVLEWRRDGSLATRTVQYINGIIKILNEQMCA